MVSASALTTRRVWTARLARISSTTSRGNRQSAGKRTHVDVSDFDTASNGSDGLGRSVYRIEICLLTFIGCNCNNHATSCHHDAAVFELTGRTSGGVCDGCTDNTMGRNCEQCKQYFYQDPTKPFTDRDVCLRKSILIIVLLWFGIRARYSSIVQQSAWVFGISTWVWLCMVTTLVCFNHHITYKLTTFAGYV